MIKLDEFLEHFHPVIGLSKSKFEAWVEYWLIIADFQHSCELPDKIEDLEDCIKHRLTTQVVFQVLEYVFECEIPQAKLDTLSEEYVENDATLSGLVTFIERRLYIKIEKLEKAIINNFLIPNKIKFNKVLYTKTSLAYDLSKYFNTVVIIE